MERKHLALIIFVSIMVLPITCFSMGIGIKGGMHKPIAEYSDFYKMGYTLGGQLTAPYNDLISWGAHIAYAKSESDNIDSDSSTLIEIYPFINFYPFRNDQADLFLRGGIGINLWEFKSNSVDFKIKNNDTDIMYTIGAGVNFLRDFEIIATYNQVLKSDDDINYFTFTIGYNFRL
jgi:opacity protein-like surface antigen